MKHKPLCNINIACSVIHLDGKCPGPYGKCDCMTTERYVQGKCCAACEDLGEWSCRNAWCSCHSTEAEVQKLPDGAWAGASGSSHDPERCNNMCGYHVKQSTKESGGWEDKYWFLARGLSTAEKNAILDLIRELLISERAAEREIIVKKLESMRCNPGDIVTGWVVSMADVYREITKD